MSPLDTILVFHPPCLMRVLLVLVLAAASATITFAAPGEFDLSFAQGGIVRLSSDITLPTDGQATSISVDGTGKLYVTGVNNQTRTGVMARLTASGALDTTFAGTGFIFRALAPLDSRREAVRAFPLANGSAMLIEGVVGLCFGSLGGCSVSGRLDPQFVATKLLADGSVDSAYRNGASLGYIDTSITLVADGSLTAMSARQQIWGRQFILLRYDTNGQPDPLFNETAVAAAINCGPAYTEPPPSLSGAAPLKMRTAIQGNNRLLIAQQLRHNLTNSNDICITRLNPDGTRDLTFGSSGQTVISDAGLASHFPFKILVRANGSINLLLLNGPPKSIHRPAMVWLAENGAVDATRGPLGVVNPLIVPGMTSISDAALQTDDKLLLVGYGSAPGIPQAADLAIPRVSRLGIRGEIDFGFGPFRSGNFDLYSGTTRFAPNEITVAPNGNIFLAGAAGDSNPNNPTAIAVARLQGDVAPMAPPTGSDGGGGGCGYTQGGPFDPTLPAVMLFALWCLFGRRRQRLQWTRVKA